MTSLREIIELKEFRRNVKKSAKLHLKEDKETSFGVLKSPLKVIFSDIKWGNGWSSHIIEIPDEYSYDEMEYGRDGQGFIFDFHYHPLIYHGIEGREYLGSYVYPSTCNSFTGGGDLVSLHDLAQSQPNSRLVMMVAGVHKKRPLEIDILAVQESDLLFEEEEIVVDQLAELEDKFKFTGYRLKSNKVPFHNGNLEMAKVLNESGYKAEVLMYRRDRVINPRAIDGFIDPLK